MTDVEVVLDLFGFFVASLRREVEGLSEEALGWQPDPQANSIGITVWHVARWMDVLGAHILGDVPAEQEQWHVQGWRERTGYDPRGVGAYGLGAITGYTQEEVAAIPSLSADELLTYLDQTHSVVANKLQTMSSDALYQPVPPGVLTGTTYQWLKVLIRGFFGHVGEIQALKAMRERMLAEAAL